MTKIATYEDLKKAYNTFKKNPPTDSFTTYFKEISFMDSLINFAKKQGFEEDIFKYQTIKDNAIKELNKIRKSK